MTLHEKNGIGGHNDNAKVMFNRYIIHSFNYFKYVLALLNLLISTKQKVELRLMESSFVSISIIGSTHEFCFYYSINGTTFYVVQEPSQNYTMDSSSFGM